jgi:hypothetical protein
MVHEYAKGGRNAYETSDDGGDFKAQLDGEWKAGERICAFVEAACDNTEDGYDRLLEALDWLTQEIKKRKDNAVKVAG